MQCKQLTSHDPIRQREHTRSQPRMPRSPRVVHRVRADVLLGGLAVGDDGVVAEVLAAALDD